MKKSTKGALAATAAGVLLLGGAGSLAFWSDTATITGSTINSGSLTLTDEDCSEFVHAGSPAADLLDSVVPGDTITKTCTYTINATGDNLSANLAATGGTATGTLASGVTVTPSFTVGGSVVSSITDLNDGDTLTSKITVAFPYGATASNVSQLKTLNLADYVVTATQN